MAKFVFVFVLALIALQGSDAHLLREDATGKNVQDFITELKKVIQESTARFIIVYAELQSKMVGIEHEANVSGLFEDFKQQVEELWTHEGAGECESVAKEQITEVVQLANEISCKLEINEQMTALRKQLEVLTSKVGDLVKEIGRDVYNCLRESQGNQEKFTQCINEKISNAERKLQVVETEIIETFNVIEKTIPVITDKFSTCVADHKDKLVAKMGVAYDTLKKCVDGNNAKLFTLQGSEASLLREDAAGSNVLDLVNKLKKLLQETASRFADVYTELKDKIVEIENEANVSGLFEDFKQKVEQLWTHEGASACESVAKEQITEVVQLANEISCKIEINGEMAALKKQLEVLSSKVRDLLEEIARDFYNCLWESHGNQEKFTQCMDEKVSNTEQKLQVVENEIIETFNVIEKTIPVITDKFSTCVADHKDKLVAKIEVAEDTLKKCVDGNNRALFTLQSSDASLLREDAAGNNVQDLVNELKKLIQETASRFADVYTGLKDKIVEIETEANVSGLFEDFKQQVEELWTHEGAAACESVAKEQITEVVQLAIEISCKLEINEEVFDLKKQLEVLGSKVEDLLKEIGRDVYNCLRESNGNHEKFTQCMDEKVSNAEQKLQVVETEIDETFNVIEKTIPVFTDKFSTCVTDHKDKLIAKIQVAEDTLKKCVDGNN